MKLHPFQTELVDRLRAAYGSGKRAVVMQLGTGGGKTACSSEMLRSAVGKGKRAVFCAHLDTLIADTHARLAACGVHAGFVQAGRPTDPTAPVQVCSLATLHRRGELPPADVVVLDECHRAMAATVRPILEAYPEAKLLGLTATPQRGDAQPLGDVFDAMVSGPSNRWLTEQGYLVPCDLLAPPTYVDEGLIADPVEAYQRATPGTRAIVFATNVAHAEDITRRFVEAGIAAECITGDTSREVRGGVRARLQSRATLVLVGVGVFIEGWDEPSVETVILARAFSVTGAFLQAVGRGLRPSKATGKACCVVLDLRGAVHLHGLPDEDRVWSLTGAAVRRAEAMTALRRCTKCLAIFRPAVECPRCGACAENVAELPRVLSKAERLERISHLPQNVRDGKYLAQLERVARTRIRLPEHRVHAWAVAAFCKRFGRPPESEAA